MPTRLLLKNGVMYLDTANARVAGQTLHQDVPRDDLTAAAATMQTEYHYSDQGLKTEHVPAQKHLCQGSNIGSVGHPHFCQRICLYFHAGRCKRGVLCGFCHHDHHDKCDGHRNLTGDDKMILEKMGKSTRESLLSSILQAKVAAMQVERGSSRAAQQWLRSVGEVAPLEALPLPKLAGTKPSSVRKMVSRLQTMNLYVLRGIVFRVCSDSVLLEATEILLNSLPGERSCST